MTYTLLTFYFYRDRSPLKDLVKIRHDFSIDPSITPNYLNKKYHYFIFEISSVQGKKAFTNLLVKEKDVFCSATV